MLSGKHLAPVLAALVLAVTVGRSAPPAVAVTLQAEDFLSAVVLAPPDVASGMTVAQQNYVATSDVAFQGSPDAQANLEADGFLNGYEQAFKMTTPLTALLGGPVGAGEVISVFNDAGGASAWNQYEAANDVQYGEQVAAAQGATVTITDSSPIDLSAYGDEASGAEMHGTAAIGGRTTNVVVDIGLIRRDRVQFTVVAAGLKGQQQVLVKMVQALDANVVNNLGLLNGQ